MEKNFGRISRNKVEDIRVSLKEVNGTPHVELRVYARSPRRGEAPIPEMEAIVVPIQNLFDLCQILEQAHDHLLKEGLVQVPYIAQAVNLTPDDQSPPPVMDVPGASPDALRARNVPVKLPFESHLLGAPDTRPAKELPQQVTGEIRILSGRGALVWSAPSPIAKLPETPRETPKPAEPQAQAAKPAPEPPAKPTVPEVRERGRFSVQVASLVVKRNALSLKKRLERLGYDPIIQKIKVRITRHRVTAGEFRDREAADQTARSLGADGFSSRLVEGEHGQFAVEVGWFFNQNDAIDLARHLQKKNYTSKIVSKTALTPVYAVRVGAYEKRSEAFPAIKALKRKGLAPILVGY